jgi:hypothetical protein
MSRPDYNHSRWPSPRARLVAIKLGLDVISLFPRTRMKRLTHVQALELLAKKARTTVPDFLNMSMDDSLISLGCYRETWDRQKISFNPLYAKRR